jgi:hypothetical protein
LKRVKWFWSWQDEKEENWLREMARTGWKLSAISLPGLYKFIKISPENIFFRLDYHNRQKLSMNAYLDTLFEDGWEFITKANGWLYFSKVSAEDVLSIKQDAQAKTDKLTREVSTLGSALPLMIMWFPLFGSRTDSPTHEILLIVYVLLLVYFLFIIIKGYQRILQLRKQS